MDFYTPLELRLNIQPMSISVIIYSQFLKDALKKLDINKILGLSEEEKKKKKGESSFRQV